ncbi:MAG: diguanylate cyclase domain-containing protein [Gammaproteobacteria bacterium]
MAKLTALLCFFVLINAAPADDHPESPVHPLHLVSGSELSSIEKSWLATHKVLHHEPFNDPSRNQSGQTGLLTAKEKAWLKNHKTIRIAFDGAMPPYSFVNDSNRFEGIAVDIFDILGKKLGIRFEPYPNTHWNTLYKAAARRKVDVVATMVNRPEREFWFNFTQPYIKKSLAIITHQTNSSISNRADLAGKSVALDKDYQYSYEIIKEFPTVKPYFVDTMLDALKSVGQRKTDAAIVFTATANYLQDKYRIGNLKFADFYDRHSTDESIAVRKDWPVLANILQKGLDSISEKQINAIYSKWVAPVVSPIAQVSGDQAPEQVPDRNAVERGLAFQKPSKTYLIAAILLLLLLLIRNQNKKIKLANREAQNAIKTVQQLQSDLDRLIQNRSAELSTNENTFRSLIENQNSEYFFYKYDCNGTFIYVSPSVTLILGYTPDEFMCHYREYLTSNPANLKVNEYIEECTKGIPNPPYQIEIYDSQKRTHWLEVNDSPVYDEYGICIGVDGVMHEITARKQTADHLIWLSYYDELTGLANRRLFMDRLQQYINLTLRKNLSFSLLFLDLDRFKWVNDTMGHSAGDEILKEAAKRLLSALRDSDVAARFGGDEFALLLPETSKEASALVAEKIISALKHTFILGKQPVNLGVSIGIAVYPDDGSNCEALIKQADSAMYYAKKQSIGFAFVPGAG